METKTARYPKVAIIGRVNVGKSTLFNRLTENRLALTSAVAGTTRDRKYGEVIWRGQKFEIIDTGGLEIPEKNQQNKNKLIKTINQQVERAIEESEAVIFLVDAKDGPMPADKRLALSLKKLRKPFLLTANKIDQQKFLPKINEFYKLGCGEPLPISAANGSGTGDLLDRLIELLPPWAEIETIEEKPALRLALIGKPNVGKSSLINALTGEERAVVDESPHTTREPQDTLIEYAGRQFILIDTAGIRKKSKINKGLESKGVARSIQAIRKAEVAVLVIEASQPLGNQEKHLTQVLTEAGCGVIIAANKWDLVVDKKTGVEQKFLDYFHRHFPYLAFAPIVFISAKTGQRVKKILDSVLAVQTAREKTVEEKTLDKFIKQMVKLHKPTKAKGVKHPRIFGLKQIGVKPPTFLLKIDQKSGVHFSYLRFLENRLRQEFGFIGTPIKIVYKTLR
ncbi:MAG: ribosome biogenesis GTPase Der [bacterium]